MQPMAAHKGYGLAVLVELLTGVLSGGAMSMMGDIVSWCFELEKPNKVCHAFIAIDVDKFVGGEEFAKRTEAMAEKLQCAQGKGQGQDLHPGEMEWERHGRAMQDAIELPPTWRMR